ncbi:nucleoside-diphosphate kinase [Candidatus Babeliales bacterium]|nr:nucleoside-diphosphate kinase [Candidatus Babeliales bacterium]
MLEKTLAIIKPDAVEAKNTGKIIDKIEQEGFNILKIKKEHLIKDQATKFYDIHKEKPFFNDLIKFIISNPVIIMVLEKENAISDWRKTMGATDPQKADENTIRKIYGTNIDKNATHGSDSPQNAKKEIEFFFTNF